MFRHKYAVGESGRPCPTFRGVHAKTLVGGEDDEGFLLQSEAIKDPQYLAHSVIYAAHLGSISPDCSQVAYVLSVLAEPGMYRFARK